MVTQAQTVVRASPDEVRDWLEWAGATLLAMRLRSPFPREFRAAWPEFPSDFNDAYGYTAESFRVPAPSSADIDLMDTILALPSLVDDPTTRRILHRRALVTPLTGRYIHSYRSIALLLHSDERRVARLHKAGLVRIAGRMPYVQVCSLRNFLRPFHTTS